MSTHSLSRLRDCWAPERLKTPREGNGFLALKVVITRNQLRFTENKAFQEQGKR